RRILILFRNGSPGGKLRDRKEDADRKSTCLGKDLNDYRIHEQMNEPFALRKDLDLPRTVRLAQKIGRNHRTGIRVFIHGRRESCVEAARMSALNDRTRRALCHERAAK